MEVANSVVATSDGGYALTGYTESFGAGSEDVWLVKTDAFGNMQWNRTYGETGEDMNELAKSLIATSDGGFALLGSRVPNSRFPFYASESWLAKTDAYGNLEWNQTYTTGVSALVATFDGGYAFAGADDLVKTDVLGNIQWEKTYEGSNWLSLVVTSDGGYGLAGYIYSNTSGNDFWFAKTDALGNMQWNQTYGGPDNDIAFSLVATSDGGYAIAGLSYSFDAGKSDFWLVKTDAVGNMQWNKTYGGPGDDQATSLVATSDGGYAVVGIWNETYPFDVNVVLIKTDAFGNMLWNQTYGGASDEMAFSLVATSDGGYAIAGSTSSFGAGGGDFWLVKTDENGVVPEYSSRVIPILVVTAALFILINKKKLLHTRSKEP
jgi:hypothetical protein